MALSGYQQLVSRRGSEQRIAVTQEDSPTQKVWRLEDQQYQINYNTRRKGELDL
jgi:hypothetical protein